jgi:hypothetical protein
VDWEADRAGGVEEARVICKEGVGANSERSGEEAGRAITFASDAHTTDALAGNSTKHMAMAEHPGRHPVDFWTR